MSELSQQFQLPDGRKLGYDDYGVPEGKPVFYLHGAPSARVEFPLFGNNALLESLGARLIAVDRPGVGLSDFQPNRRLLDLPKDLLALADHLHIERFAVLAYSLGGPYGFACAYAIPDRLMKVGIVSGAALFTEPELMHNVNEGTRKYLSLPRESPLAARAFLWILGTIARVAPKRFIAQASSMLPKADRAIVATNPVFQHGFIKMVREHFRRGIRGPFHESLLTVSPWEFRLEEIQTPILLWHGEEDLNIPVAMARYAATALPNCEARFYPEEGHLSLFKKYIEEIIRALIN